MWHLYFSRCLTFLTHLTRNQENMRRPKKPLIIYDGQCSFCINAIKRIRKQAKEGQFDYIPNQDPDLYIAYPQLVKFLSHEGMRFINQKGKAFCGADSVYQIYRRLRWSQYIAWIYVVPGIHRICKIVYFIIAKNRYRLSRTVCDSDVCDAG